MFYLFKTIYFIFDTLNNQWLANNNSNISQLILSRTDLDAGCSFNLNNTKLFVFGGQGQNKIECYDIIRNKWWYTTKNYNI